MSRLTSCSPAANDRNSHCLSTDRRGARIGALAFLLLAACGSTPSVDGGPVVEDAATPDRDAQVVLDAATVDAATIGDGGPPDSPCEEFRAGRTLGTRVCALGAQPGYTLFSPSGLRATYLIDLDGRVIHEWTHTLPPGQLAYLLEDGRLLRPTDLGPGAFVAGGQAGGLELIAWDGTVEWSFQYMSSTVRAHHDVAWLPSGNVVIIAWELVSGADAVAAGRREPLADDELWPEHLIEVHPEPGGGATIVWEWHAWDHLVQDNDPALPTYGDPSEHPGRIDIDFGGTRNADWLHFNAIDYDPVHDQLIVSAHATSEVWIIDHGTTTEEAAGPAGDLLYRWGNPEAWRSGTAAERTLFHQHNPHIIEEGLPGAGHLLVFNNGERPARAQTTVDELALPRTVDGLFAREADGHYGPDELVWTYSDPDFSATFISGAQRLSGGNTAICEGVNGRLFEVTPDGTMVWEYRVPLSALGRLIQGTDAASSTVFRAHRYDATYPGLAGRDLTPGEFIELPAPP